METIGLAAAGSAAAAAVLFALALCAWALRRMAEARRPADVSTVEPLRPAVAYAPSVSSPPPASASSAHVDEGGRTAAAVALALQLHGVFGAPSPEVAAAIGAALALHGALQPRALGPAAAGPGAWGMAGRLEGMARWPSRRAAR